jgi:pimeloyl-ACP methyl ester carboxylesterase
LLALLSVWQVFGQTGCAHLIYPLEVTDTELLFATTDDGWRLAVHHLAPMPGVTPRHYPVVFCHGISSTRTNWDLSERLSFPRYLTRLGFDVYLMELRASGDSDQPTWTNDLSWDYTADDYALRDLPAVVELVRSRTGAAQVHFAGHSMGGLVLYGYLERVGNDAIRSAITVGSPAYILDHNHSLQRAPWMAPLADFFFDGLPSRAVARMWGPLAGYPFTKEFYLIWNFDAITPRTGQLGAAHGVSNISTNIGLQFARAVSKHHLASWDGKWDYTENLKLITAPILFATGALDQLVPPAIVMYAYNHVSSADKKLLVLSRANGFAHDYGHVDSVLGETAPTDVFPLLGDWVLAHD